jgi:hypothetical protein
MNSSTALRAAIPRGVDRHHLVHCRLANDPDQSRSDLFVAAPPREQRRHAGLVQLGPTRWREPDLKHGLVVTRTGT